LISFLQLIVGILDLIGIVLIGALGALSINGINSKTPGERVSKFLSTLQIENWDFEQQVLFLTMSATIVLLARTSLSIYLSRKTLHFLASKSATLSNRMFSSLLHTDYKTIKSLPSQEFSFAINRGMDLLVVGILGTFISLIVDLTTLVLVTGALFLVDPLIAFASLTLFTLTGYLLFALTHKRGNRYGKERSRLEIATNMKFLEALSTYREISIHNRQDYYSEEVGKLRARSSYAVAEMNFLPNVSKFVIESLVILTAVFIGLSQFLINDAFRAVGTLTVFLAAGSRIAPAALRVQHGFLQIRINSGQVNPTIDLLNRLSRVDLNSKSNVPGSDLNYFIPEIDLIDVNFKYGDNEKFEMSGLNLRIDKGEMVALVGASGGGKSTLVDLLLGIIEPTSGSVLISGALPRQTITRFPKAISYLPQSISLIDGSVRENVCLGFPLEEFSDKQIWNVLDLANLKHFVENLEGGLNFQIGENGNFLSGGQRQRLGLARALITSPQILVLDEATSSLDAETEAIVADALDGLKGAVTIIVVAHRLSSVKKADKLVYLKDGKIISVGTFDQVKSSTPEFEHQVKLLSL
jgi:ATP-binding cassette subfamily C protein